MTAKNHTTPNFLPIVEQYFSKIGMKFDNLSINKEGTDYGACRYNLNNLQVVHRVSKITPKKTGQFVTIWKRDIAGKTTPYDIKDDFDIMIITSECEGRLGIFNFPKLVLAERGVITTDSKKGICGMRVYPPWDIVTNKQALKTQSWQLKYFVEIQSQIIN